MKVLGIETSCDETAAAVVEDGRLLLSNVIYSQVDIHKVYGGVVPEIAASSHIEVINPVIDQALAKANCGWDEIDTIAVTYAPGLIGSLLIGTLAARTLAILHNKPLYPVHHVEAHVYANFVTKLGSDKQAPNFPILALIVSGGHTQLVLFHDHGNFELLGQTQDDAAGEAFDKVAKILGLPYPGGPSIAKAALKGNPTAYSLPKARLTGEYDFSFSGLKTAVLRAVQREVGVDFDFPSHELPRRLDEPTRNNFAASFQRIAVETLAEVTKQAFYDQAPRSVVIAGGVAANSELRRVLSAILPINIKYAPTELCTDNAAMVASLGFYQAKLQPPVSPFDLEVKPSLAITAH
jgi:N6-L-threonylcarbamoyladenine synthase